MENNQNAQGGGNNKVSWLGKYRVVIFVLVGVIIILFLGIYALGWYGDWKFNKDLKALQQESDRPYLEDTYGGKTPKETLEMFITAVEKEDFDLASKYFVLSKQEEWRGGLINGKEKGNLDVFIKNMKMAEDRGSLWEGNYQMEVKNIQEGLSIVIDFIKYPQGIWKIQEI
mgnify:CR=1 FL=1